MIRYAPPMEQPKENSFLEKLILLIPFQARKETAAFLKLGVPMYFTQLATQLIGINSVIQSGNYSSDVLAGILLANGIWFPIFIGFGGIIFFVTPMVAQLYGANKLNQIGPLVQQGFWLVIPIIMIGMIILYNATVILDLAGIDEDITKHTQAYLGMFMFALPAIMLIQPLRSLSEGITKPFPVTVANIVMLIMAIIGNYALIYGNFGFPEMGAKGAGISAIIGTWTAFIGLLIYVIWVDKDYKPTHFSKQLDLPSWRTIKEIVQGGWPMGLGNFIELTMFSGATLILGRLGSEVIAAHGIALNIGGFFFMVPLSIGMAASVIVGKQIGEENLLGAKYSTYFSMKFGTMLALINSLILILYSELIVSSFFSSDPEVIAIAVILLKFAAFFQVADAIAMCGIGSLRGYKDTFGPMIIMFVSYWLVAIPVGSYISIYGLTGEPLGAAGMWSGMCLGLCIAAVLVTKRVKKTTESFAL